MRLLVALKRNPSRLAVTSMVVRVFAELRARWHAHVREAWFAAALAALDLAGIDAAAKARGVRGAPARIAAVREGVDGSWPRGMGLLAGVSKERVMAGGDGSDAPAGAWSRSQPTCPEVALSRVSDRMAPLVDDVELRAKLGVSTRFSTWIPRNTVGLGYREEPTSAQIYAEVGEVAMRSVALSSWSSPSTSR